MQTFLPYSNFTSSAFVLDSKRLGKQRVENMQLMSALTGLKLTNTFVMREKGAKWFYYDSEGFEVDELDMEPDQHYDRKFEPTYKRVELPSEFWKVVEVEKPGWVNHPVTRMWRGYEWALLKYQMAITKEWQHRGHYDTCFPKTFKLFFASGLETKEELPPWFGVKEFHRAHKSNLLRKDPKFYGPIFRGIPDNLPYLYPPKTEKR